MIIIKYLKKPYKIPKNKNLLSGLLDLNLKIPHACRRGVCHSCLLQVTSGTIPTKSQTGLSEQQKQNNCILACQTEPIDNMDIQPVQPNDLNMIIIDIRQLNFNIAIFTLTSKKIFLYDLSIIELLRKNERIVIKNPNFQYNNLTFHIERAIGNKFTYWLLDEAKRGDWVKVIFKNTKLSTD